MPLSSGYSSEEKSSEWDRMKKQLFLVRSEYLL
jgi:hypothetical protein